ncbi:tir-1 [Pristionchus pacificus]|nr:tir-1 [Pristionchus pacificus]
MGDEGATRNHQLSRQDASVSSCPSPSSSLHPSAAYNLPSTTVIMTNGNHTNLSRTDDLWLELEDDDILNDSPEIQGKNAVAVSVPMSAPPIGVQLDQNGHSSYGNSGTPTIMRNDEAIRNEMDEHLEDPPQSAPPVGKPNGILHHNGESGGHGMSRLQQSLSTPCPQENVPSTTRKESEYRRFKSEGSQAGQLPAGPEVEATLDDLSPDEEGSYVADGVPMLPTSTISIPHSERKNRMPLFPQDSVVTGPLAKHSKTEQVMMMHTLKTKMSKYTAFFDKAFQHLAPNAPDEQIIEGCTIIAKVMTKAWLFPKISHDLSYALCDYMRDNNYFDNLIAHFVSPSKNESVRLACGRVLEECMSTNNREYIVNKGLLRKIATTAEKLNKNPDQQRMSLSIMENLFKHSSATSNRLIDYGVLDHILLTCKRATDTPKTLRHAALALANLALYSDNECKKKIIQKKVPEWLFLLASQHDDITRYYACLAVCMLASTKELEHAVIKSGTLPLVESFLKLKNPQEFAQDHYKYSQNRPPNWLTLLLPMLRSKTREAKQMAAFHLTMEATIKKEQNKLDLFEEIGAIQALKEVASSPDEVAAKFASEALTVIGEEVPYKLAQQVPNWTINDVQYWVKKIGFEEYAPAFSKHMVDGDLLLHLSEKELEDDLCIKSGILRKRFVRELESLKIAADYSGVDDSQLDSFLMSLSPELSVYTYNMLTAGINRSILPSLTDDVMMSACGIANPIHRLKLKQAFQDAKHIDDIEIALLRQQIDVFISYRRATGNQLASLIKVLLQLRGYKVFIDVDKLYAGKFDASLLKNIQAAKHFILVLTPNSLDRLLNDVNCDDWIHKELRCAFEHNKNVIPIFDQHFEFPDRENDIPQDIRNITKYNGVRWVHDYQEACMDKVERFIKGELGRVPSINQTSTPSSTRKVPTRWGSAVRQTSTSSGKFSVNRGQLDTPPTPNFGGASIEKQRRKAFHGSSTSTVMNGNS